MLCKASKLPYICSCFFSFKFIQKCWKLMPVSGSRHLKIWTPQHLKILSLQHLSVHRKTLRRSRVERKAGLWDGLKQSIIRGTNILNSASGLTGEVLNPFRGLSLRHSFPFSPFATDVKSEDEDQEDRVDLKSKNTRAFIHPLACLSSSSSC